MDHVAATIRDSEEQKVTHKASIMPLWAVSQHLTSVGRQATQQQHSTAHHHHHHHHNHHITLLIMDLVRGLQQSHQSEDNGGRTAFLFLNAAGALAGGRKLGAACWGPLAGGHSLGPRPVKGD